MRLYLLFAIFICGIIGNFFAIEALAAETQTQKAIDSAQNMLHKVIQKTKKPNFIPKDTDCIESCLNAYNACVSSTGNKTGCYLKEDACTTACPD